MENTSQWCINHDNRVLFVASLPELFSARRGRERAYRVPHGFQTVDVKVIGKPQDTPEEETKKNLGKVEGQEMGEATVMAAG